jgi:hypothetical protein
MLGRVIANKSFENVVILKYFEMAVSKMKSKVVPVLN